MATTTIAENIAAGPEYRQRLNDEAKKRGMIKSVMLRRALDAYFFSSCGAKFDQTTEDSARPITEVSQTEGSKS